MWGIDRCCKTTMQYQLLYTFEVPVINCKRRAISSLLNARTTSQNHCTTGEAAVYPVYSVFAFKSSTAIQHAKNKIKYGS